MIKDLTDACVKYAKQRNVAFSYKGKKLSLEETFADFGVLPGIVKRASKISSVCTGGSFGESYPKKEKSHLGYVLEMNEPSMDLPLMMLFVVDVLEAVIGAKTEGVVVLDEFSYE